MLCIRHADCLLARLMASRRDISACPGGVSRCQAPRVVIAGHGNHFLLLVFFSRSPSQVPGVGPAAVPGRALASRPLTLPGALAARLTDALLPDELNLGRLGLLLGLSPALPETAQDARDRPRAVSWLFLSGRTALLRLPPRRSARATRRLLALLA